MPPGVAPPRRPARRMSTLDINFAMDAQIPPAPGAPFYVVFIGAGGINFGSVEEGPWNHSFRLEHKLGPRLKVTALIDPNTDTAAAVLKIKCQSFVTSAYQDAKIFKSLEDYLQCNDTPEPHAVIIGSPPAFHGGILPGKDVEMQLSKKYPNVAMFVEKPISTSSVEDVLSCADRLRQNKHVVSVGYMLRYLKTVQKVKEMLYQNNLTVMGLVARYASAYPPITKQFWWNKEMSCGPVVEQGTHFVDLCRFIAGEVDLSTVQAHAVEYFDPAGKLSSLRINEEEIPEAQRIPRMTSATWTTTNGAVCSFNHSLALHGTKYETSLDIYCDGWQFRIVDFYTSPVLYVRTPASDDREEVYTFPDDDPYFGEFSTFIDACENRGPNLILSTFDDAATTYQLTWAIREASERSSAFRYSQAMQARAQK